MISSVLLILGSIVTTFGLADKAVDPINLA
jgi:hypothetical protein